VLRGVCFKVTLLKFNDAFVCLFVVVFVPQVTQSTDFNELAQKEPWLLSTKLVVKPDMLFGKRGKSGLVALNLDLSQVSTFVKERLGKEVFYFPLYHSYI
jgi:succinyl-CoA synthetase beta subunit